MLGAQQEHYEVTCTPLLKGLQQGGTRDFSDPMISARKNSCNRNNTKDRCCEHIATY